MTQITSKIEPKIILPEHEVTMLSTNDEQVGHPLEYDREYMQTRVHGIMAPLLFFNGIAVDYPNISAFELDWTGIVPTIKFEFADRNDVFGRYSKPGLTNEIQLQILPAHDKTYKKINLLFYVTDISINGGMIRGEASYKVKEFVQTKYESLGEKSTYELVQYIAEKTGMGFASNLTAADDKRYIQVREESYQKVLMSEMEKSLADQETVQDVWVDLWNNLVLMNMQDRFSTIDAEEDMQVWIRSELMPDATAHGEKQGPQKALALFSNSPLTTGTELSIDEYILHTAGGGGYSSGTSKAVCVYMENEHNWSYSYSADGDVDGDEFISSEYGGEEYGSGDSIKYKHNRETFFKKLNSECVSIFTAQPLLGINRGDQIRVLWYDANDNIDMNDAMLEISKKDHKFGWISAMDNIADPDTHLRVNYQVSGQYIVNGIHISWQNERWDVEYILTKPARRKIDLLDGKAQ